MKVVVIGAGASGLMAAGQAAAAGAEVLVLEKNDRPGKKILITGNGRCNVTNAAQMPDLIRHYPGNGRFLYSCLKSFGSHDLIGFLRNLGLETKIEADDRVFPATDKATDVVNTLVNFCQSLGVRFVFNAPVTDITLREGRVFSAVTRRGDQPCDAIVLAAGGASYPATGSTGDGYRLAEKLGHTIEPLKPSLVPLETKETWVREIKGLSFQDAEITARMAPNRTAVVRGELLFTHFGLSGPAVLKLSRMLADDFWAGNEIPAAINLKPGLGAGELEAELKARLAGAARKQFQSFLGEILPKSMAPVILKILEIETGKPVHQLTREERRRLLDLTRGLPLTLAGTRPLSEAIVTSGGVRVKEINPRTMASKVVPGLFLAGEVVDVDGYTGGFNLQAAFSMGYAAGHHAAEI